MSLDASARITESLRYLDREISASRDEFRRDNQPDGSALLEGVLSLGYVHRGRGGDNSDRVALTEMGRRRLQAVSNGASS